MSEEEVFVSVSKVVVTEFLTLDGVMEAPGGEFHPEGKGGWTFRFFDEEAGKLKLDELNVASALLLGRITYEHFAAAWPGMTDEQGFAERMNSLPKFVASTTLKEPLSWNATLIGGDIAEAVSRLKKQPGGDILVCGSAALVHALLRQDLVDELRVMLFPVVLGSGKRLFREGIGSTDLQLVDSRALASGVVALTYARA
jgi:dihydrofolate reductase